MKLSKPLLNKRFYLKSVQSIIGATERRAAVWAFKVMVFVFLALAKSASSVGLFIALSNPITPDLSDNATTLQNPNAMP